MRCRAFHDTPKQIAVSRVPLSPNLLNMLVTDHSPRPVISLKSMRFSFSPLRDSRVPGFQDDTMEQVPFKQGRVCAEQERARLHVCSRFFIRVLSNLKIDRHNSMYCTLGRPITILNLILRGWYVVRKFIILLFSIVLLFSCSSFLTSFFLLLFTLVCALPLSLHIVSVSFPGNGNSPSLSIYSLSSIFGLVDPLPLNPTSGKHPQDIIILPLSSRTAPAFFTIHPGSRRSCRDCRPCSKETTNRNFSLSDYTMRL